MTKKTVSQSLLESVRKLDKINDIEVNLEDQKIIYGNNQIKFQIDGETIISKSFSTSPDNPYHVIIEWEKISTVSNVLMILLDGEEEILRIQI